MSVQLLGVWVPIMRCHQMPPNPPPWKNGDTKIGYNSAYARDTQQILAPTKGFSGSANLMVSVKLSSNDPCCHGNEKLGIFPENVP